MSIENRFKKTNFVLNKSALMVGVIALLTQSCGTPSDSLLATTSSDSGANSSLISTTSEPAGSNCEFGGVKITTGVDDDSNGVLDSSEIDSTSYVCNGASVFSLAETTVENPGENCTNGGVKMETGVDDDSSGTLEATEVENTQYICNGAQASSFSLVKTSNEAAGNNCTTGGVRIDTGLDDDDDGVLSSEEIDETHYACNGSSTGSPSGIQVSLVNTTSEAAGANCSAGGLKVESGVDDNGDSSLDAGEVDQTEYVCNGTDGSGGMSPYGQLACFGTLENTTLAFSYVGTVFDDGSVLAYGSIKGTSFEVGSTSFYDSSQNGAQNGSVILSFDVTGSANAGWWDISVDQDTLITVINYHDYDLSGGLSTWTMQPDKCQLSIY